MNKNLYYWVYGGMTAEDLDGYFRLVEFDELGFGVDPMTEQELEDEMQSFAYEFGMSEAEVREYFADRVADGAYRDLRWERYMECGE